MKPGLLERIRTVGHWRIVIRPHRSLAETLTLGRCFEEVERARVSIRGWDYPHISRRNDEQGGTERTEQFVENWCDWHTQVEFWRMYKSSQFLSYSALYDDMEALAGGQPLGAELNVMDVIYSVSEFTEFAYRLAANGLYAQGFSIQVGLVGTSQRRLVAGRGRIPFFDAMRTAAAKIEIERSVTSDELDAGAQPTALSILLEIFDHFGWNPSPDQLSSEQRAFYSRQFG